MKFNLNKHIITVVFLLLAFTFNSCSESAVDQSSGKKIYEIKKIYRKKIDYDQMDGNKDDPLLKYQWSLYNNGQELDFLGPVSPLRKPDNDMKTREAHNTRDSAGRYIRGEGIVINITDEHVEARHEDLRVDIENSYNYRDKVKDPTPRKEYDGRKILKSHGTAVAGVAAAISGNGVGGIGVAPGATIIAHNTHAPYLPPGVYESALGVSDAITGKGAKKSDVINMSWAGSGPFSTEANENDSHATAMFEKGVFGGRPKKTDPGVFLGYNYIKGAGNGMKRKRDLTTRCSSYKEDVIVSLPCHNTNQDVYNVSPFVIVVSGSNSLGIFSTYTSIGSSVFVNAPSGEDSAFQGYPALFSTDLMGCDWGYNKRDGKFYNSFDHGFRRSAKRYWENVIDYDNKDCKYTSIFAGTSGATPLVSGLVALMLQKNPDLTWRQVKYILAHSADKIDENIASEFRYKKRYIKYDNGKVRSPSRKEAGAFKVDSGWIQNAAGLNFSNFYGFGRVNAKRALELIDKGAYPDLPSKKYRPTDELAYGRKMIFNEGEVEFNPDASTAVASIARKDTDVVVFPYLKDASATTFNSTDRIPAQWIGKFDYNYDAVPVATDEKPVSFGIQKLESVIVRLNLRIYDAGQLFIRLTSPSGTKSELLLPFNAWSGTHHDEGITNKRFLSNAFYNEDPNGTWYLEVFDAWVKKVQNNDPVLAKAVLQFTGYNEGSTK